ncbi:helix-turn-helix domain-containing protein [Streptomyces sp. NPDC048637]|uniref:helix-turn-helix domain-containing protein n=1 Tax=Streptomyces sp. NPDC048637 TaxID=3155636 RepID=UPI00343DF84F
MRWRVSVSGWGARVMHQPSPNISSRSTVWGPSTRVRWTLCPDGVGLLSAGQGLWFELAPTTEQAVMLGRHCGLSRVVENFCLETVQRKQAQQEAEKTYGITGDELTKIPRSAPTLEREWRAVHPECYPWFAEGKLSSRILKEACRVRAAGIKNVLSAQAEVDRGRESPPPAPGPGRSAQAEVSRPGRGNRRGAVARCG